ncbi:MAG: hypothetical protein K6G11_02215 [Lachnospiraceae bacterium]|nr:hypothetical protein [Lachnospiraceae bacterium]
MEKYFNKITLKGVGGFDYLNPGKDFTKGEVRIIPPCDRLDKFDNPFEKVFNVVNIAMENPPLFNYSDKTDTYTEACYTGVELRGYIDVIDNQICVVGEDFISIEENDANKEIERQVKFRAEGDINAFSRNGLTGHEKDRAEKKDNISETNIATLTLFTTLEDASQGNASSDLKEASNQGNASSDLKEASSQGNALTDLKEASNQPDTNAVKSVSDTINTNAYRDSVSSAKNQIIKLNTFKIPPVNEEKSINLESFYISVKDEFKLINCEGRPELIEKIRNMGTATVKGYIKQEKTVEKTKEGTKFVDITYFKILSIC